MRSAKKVLHVNFFFKRKDSELVACLRQALATIDHILPSAQIRKPSLSKGFVSYRGSKWPNITMNGSSIKYRNPSLALH